ncbi:MAG: 50S ribosomal protein L7/L12 [Patescibacteria group bacterium]
MEKLDQIINLVSELKVIEMADLVKKMEEKFGVSAAMPVAAAGAGPGEAAEEKTAWDVVLKDGGAQKIQVIKVLREVTGLGLQEAKALVDSAPKPIKTGMKKDEAEELKKKLETAGGTVELK